MKALIITILFLACGGLAFSGYLTYRELFGSASTSCAPLGDADTLFGAPPCVYGFVMYLAIAMMAAFALLRRAPTK